MTLARLMIRLDLGPGASLGALSSVVEDLSAVHDLGLRVDAVAARRDARDHIERLWRDQPGQIFEQSLQLDEASSYDMRRLLDERRQADAFRERLEGTPPEIWFEDWYRLQRRLGGKGSGRFLSPLFPWAQGGADFQLSAIAPQVFARLVSDEVGRRQPSVPSVERLSYENPIELILVGVGGLLAGAGFKFGTFTDLARLIRDWSADKRRAEVHVEREQAEVDRTRAEIRELDARASKTEVETEVLRRYALQGNRVDDLVEAGLAPRELRAIAQLSSVSAVDVEATDDDANRASF